VTGGLPLSVVPVLAAGLVAVAVVACAPPGAPRRRLVRRASAREQPERPRSRWRPPSVPAQVAAGPLATALAADLIASALRAGSPLAAALDAVGSALSPADASRASVTASAGRDGAAQHLGRLVSSAGRALLLGATLDHALGPLRDVPARRFGRSADDAAALPRLAEVLHRSAASGARLAEQLSLLADDLRAESAAAGLAGARRLGVLAVLPLGGCFLPAFMLLAVVPTVAGLVVVLAN